MGNNQLKKISEIIQSEEYKHHADRVDDKAQNQHDPIVETAVHTTNETNAAAAPVPGEQTQDWLYALNSTDNSILNAAMQKAYLQYCREVAAATTNDEKGKAVSAVMDQLLQHKKQPPANEN
jgi:hypothetical protein